MSDTRKQHEPGPGARNPGPSLRMPEKAELVKEALKRLETQKYRGARVVGLDDATLEELCLILVDPTKSDKDAERWLGEEDPDFKEAGAYKAINRFANRFRGMYAQVRREHANRIARLSVASATGEDVRAMHKVATHRLVELVAEKLVETDSIDELQGKDLKASIATVEAVTAGQFKAAELALKKREAEGKAEKLAEEVKQLQLKNEQARQRIAERVAAIEKRLEQAEGARAKGKTVSAEVFKAMRAELVAIGQEAQP